MSPRTAVPSIFRRSLSATISPAMMACCRPWSRSPRCPSSWVTARYWRPTGSTGSTVLSSKSRRSCELFYLGARTAPRRPYVWPAAAAWSTNEEERRKALLSYFLYGVSYILWDNISRGSQISCPHIEKSCTAAYYSDRRLGVSEMVATAASAIHFFTGNNIGPCGDLASRSLDIRLAVDRPDPENRAFRHPDPIGWTESHGAEILVALYTVLLGNPRLGSPSDAEAKTRFKAWWRLIGSAVEHAAGLAGQKVDFQKLFLSQEEDDEDSASLADALAVMERRWTKFKASDVADLINRRDADASLELDTLREMNRDSVTLRDFLFGHAPAGFVATPKSVGRRLKAHVDEPVRSSERTLILRTRQDRVGTMNYFVYAAGYQ